ncbi:hypothetical protein CRG98_005081 [Punica granatum]|uniref:Uncharacterized protein n=1 Tax=Punica granatum TaxID=22663 RepID=A0A2I0L1F6_PUNGR|nr:hypothetical protein CRG98_005081 [Punica granatum]
MDFIEVVAVVVWFQSCQVDLYNPAKITENRARPGNRPDWAICGLDVTTVAPDGILRQGQWFPTPNRPPKNDKASWHGGRSQGRKGGHEGVTAALGQLMGPEGLEGNSGRSSGLD